MRKMHQRVKEIHNVFAIKKKIKSCDLIRYALKGFPQTQLCIL